VRCGFLCPYAKKKKRTLSTRTGRAVRKHGHVLCQLVLLVVVLKLIWRGFALKVFAFYSADQLLKAPALEESVDLVGCYLPRHRLHAVCRLRTGDGS
jgi:hypothetical protein